MNKYVRHSVDAKQSAVQRVLAGEPVGDVAADVGTANSVVYGWVKKAGHGVGKKQLPQVVTGQLMPKKTPLALADTVVRDSVLYLRNAKSLIYRQLHQGKIRELDEAHLLTLLALKSLEGG